MAAASRFMVRWPLPSRRAFPESLLSIVGLLVRGRACETNPQKLSSDHDKSCRQSASPIPLSSRPPRPCQPQCIEAALGNAGERLERVFDELLRERSVSPRCRYCPGLRLYSRLYLCDQASGSRSHACGTGNELSLGRRGTVRDVPALVLADQAILERADVLALVSLHGLLQRQAYPERHGLVGSARLAAQQHRADQNSEQRAGNPQGNQSAVLARARARQGANFP